MAKSLGRVSLLDFLYGEWFAFIEPFLLATTTDARHDRSRS